MFDKDKGEFGFGKYPYHLSHIFTWCASAATVRNGIMLATLKFFCSITSQTVHPTSHLQGWKMDSPATREPTIFLLAKPPEHFGGAPPIPSLSADESPKPGQIRMHSSEELHNQPCSSMSSPLHRLHKQNSFAKHNLGLEVGERS